MSDSLRPHGLYSLWNSPGQNTGVGSLSLLQGIFPTQGSNPDLPHCGKILYQLSHKGSPRILQWVAIPSPVDLPNPGIKPGSPALQVDSLPTEISRKPGRGRYIGVHNQYTRSMCRESRQPPPPHTNRWDLNKDLKDRKE